MDADEKGSCLSLAVCYQSRLKQNYLSVTCLKATFSVSTPQSAPPEPSFPPQTHIFTRFSLMKAIKPSNRRMSKES